MSSNPVNLAFRFLLELVALVTLAYWGWHQAEGVVGMALAVGVSLAGAAIWGIFAVPDDPSRSGKAPVPVPGVVRLVIELGLFAAATWALFDLGTPTVAWALGLAVVVHYAISYDRVKWLLKTR